MMEPGGLEARPSLAQGRSSGSDSRIRLDGDWRKQAERLQEPEGGWHEEGGWAARRRRVGGDWRKLASDEWRAGGIETLATKSAQVGLGLAVESLRPPPISNSFSDFLILKCLTEFQPGSDERFTSKNRGQMSKVSKTGSNRILDLHTGSIEQISLYFILD
jgi:hypothetical protein